MIARKVISASVSGSLFAILTISSISNYLFSVVLSVPLYMMYSFPVILVYGVFASIISDKAGEFISTKTENKKSEIIISGVLHVIFGLILLLYSLSASILFFIADRVLQKNDKEYKWSQAIKSLAIPLTIWLICMGIIWIEHFINVS